MSKLKLINSRSFEKLLFEEGFVKTRRSEVMLFTDTKMEDIQLCHIMEMMIYQDL